MISHWCRTRKNRCVALTCTTACIAWMLSSGTLYAGERQFLVILANSPKEFTNGGPTLVNPQLVNKQYFDTADPNIDSFAEYWREISYGDVTVRGTTTDWINLPWRITSDPALTSPDTAVPNVVNLNGSRDFEYGSSELFQTNRAMSMVDLDGDPGGNDNGPFTSLANPPYARGSGDSVWMPGERFVDMDGDGRWDGLDESRNQMDFFAPCIITQNVPNPCLSFGPNFICGIPAGLSRRICFDLVTGEWAHDDKPDLLGPWIDLNGDGAPDNPGNCMYLPDSDNDGNPNCCPSGPGINNGCDPFPAVDACAPTTWAGPNGVINDCNGNMIPDACDVNCNSQDCINTGWLVSHPGMCGVSDDRLPLTEGANPSCDESPDGIPDECQFENFGTECSEDGVGSCAIICIPLDDPLNDNMIQRCEYHDSNNNNVMDIVEPFENFLRRWDLPGGWVVADASYIRKNYAGNDIALLARGQTRTLTGDHDPLLKLGRSPMPQNAGEHAQFDPPDFWQDAGSTKMQKDFIRTPQFVEVSLNKTTPVPDWYEQAWRDRYGSTPPPWGTCTGGSNAGGSCKKAADCQSGRCDGRTPRMVPFDLLTRRCFEADAGGASGTGRAWVGCSSDFDASIIFATGADCGADADSPIQFPVLCDNRILPEERNGIGAPLIMFDGPTEFDDLPSSKYHKGGDQALGEVTSPFNSEIWGHDRGPHSPDSIGTPDGIIPAAGPYAVSVHGNFGRDAGNVLHMEMLSFRDSNVDGLVDQGELRVRGSENYLSDFDVDSPNDGVSSHYPWNRDRLMEDAIEILDDVRDFDDFVDPVAMEAVSCSRGALHFAVPSSLQRGGAPAAVSAIGVLSGILLLPPGSHPDGLFNRAPGFIPVHIEDGLGDPNYLPANLPPAAPGNPSQISWHLFVHDLVISMDAEGETSDDPTGNFQTAFAAHEYLHSWEGFPDLYDYDVFDTGAIENCPIGAWDIMSGGGLVHPIPSLKEQPCSDWARPVDLTTVLTPGVDKVLTLPAAEFVRDESYYYLENEKRPGERYYLWSAGQGFDLRMPGAGMLLLHTDVPLCKTNADCSPDIRCRNGVCRGEGSNPEAPPQQQRDGAKPTYLIVQADGNEDLQACSTGGNRGDSGDPWPGSSGATKLTADGTTRDAGLGNTPSSTWYTLNSPTGLEILDVLPDGSGSVQVKLNWVPTTIPSLRFQQPPGGVSVGSKYRVSFDATDVFGGTTIKLYYTKDEKSCSRTQLPCNDRNDCQADEDCRHNTTIGSSGVFPIGTGLRKTTAGRSELSIDWNITGIADGRYVLFAKLNPGPGSDGTEGKNTQPRSGRNNVGDGSLQINSVAIDNDALDNDDKARLETWTLVFNGQEWRVNSTLSQPVLNQANPDADPYRKATTGSPHTSDNDEVDFTIHAGTCDANSTNSGDPCTNDSTCLGGGGACEITSPFTLGDSFTFTTTGITAASRPVTIAGGRISEDPVAIMEASPLTCPSPDADNPCIVSFDGSASVDPNGAPLNYGWDFGDGSSATGVRVTHQFVRGGTFTVTLTATNRVNERFGQASLDIVVVNNSPRASVTASPLSGGTPLDVVFDASGSSDSETDTDNLIYRWDFGDGESANNTEVRGIAFQTVSHTYRTSLDHETFIAILTVIDECEGCEKEDSTTISILVGNTIPEAIVTATPSGGPAPLTVQFNASQSTDADGDTLTVDWHWDDGSPDLLDVSIDGTSGDGIVRHTYMTPGDYNPTATIKDGRSGEAIWSSPTITVTGNLAPTAAFDVIPPIGETGVPMRFNASRSEDPDGDIAAYTWDFGDGSAPASGSLVTHTYDRPNLSGFTVTLTVTDDRGVTDVATKLVSVEPPEGNRLPIAHISTGPRSGTAPLTLTFNGENSFDPDPDDELQHTWSFTFAPPGSSVSQPDDTLVGAVVTKTFTVPGTYTVTLSVDDQRGGVDEDGPQQILVSAAGDQPVGEPGGTAPLPGEQPEPPDSAAQRPQTGLCGLGMIMSLTVSLLGMVAMMVSRRRTRPSR